MNAERLPALYDKVAEAPDAIARLRRFVLELAVRGKLVDQNPADEPALELRERIAAEKIDTLPEVPMKWAFTTLGSVLDFYYGKGLEASERLEDGPVPVFWVQRGGRLHG